MAIEATHKDTKFGVGDIVDLHQTIVEPGKEKARTQVFQGTVIRIKGRDMGKTITLRRIGAQNVGIELIMPLASPLLEKIEVVREGKRGVRQSKLYYIRHKSKKEIETIYTRAKRKKSEETSHLKPKTSHPEHKTSHPEPAEGSKPKKKTSKQAKAKSASGGKSSKSA
jgi:large subunit ribosomal protein L19